MSSFKKMRLIAIAVIALVFSTGSLMAYSEGNPGPNANKGQSKSMSKSKSQSQSKSVSKKSASKQSTY